MTSYEIQKVSKKIDITPQGTFREVVEVLYRTQKGTESWIRVPVEEYDPVEMKQKIEEEARRLDAIWGSK